MENSSTFVMVPATAWEQILKDLKEIKSGINSLSDEERYKNYPETLKMKHVRQILGCSYNKVYSLIEGGYILCEEDDGVKYFDKENILNYKGSDHHKNFNLRSLKSAV